MEATALESPFKVAQYQSRSISRAVSVCMPDVPCLKGILSSLSTGARWNESRDQIVVLAVDGRQRHDEGKRTTDNGQQMDVCTRTREIL